MTDAPFDSKAVPKNKRGRPKKQPLQEPVEPVEVPRRLLRSRAQIPAAASDKTTSGQVVRGDRSTRDSGGGSARPKASTGSGSVPDGAVGDPEGTIGQNPPSSSLSLTRDAEKNLEGAPLPSEAPDIRRSFGLAKMYLELFANQQGYMEKARVSIPLIPLEVEPSNAAKRARTQTPEVDQTPGVGQMASTSQPGSKSSPPPMALIPTPISTPTPPPTSTPPSRSSPPLTSIPPPIMDELKPDDVHSELSALMETLSSLMRQLYKVDVETKTPTRDEKRTMSVSISDLPPFRWS